MTCQTAPDAIVQALYGELDGAGLAELRGHLATCPACAAERRRLRQAVQAVARGEGHARPEVDLADARPSRHVGRLAAAAAVIVVVAGAAMMLSRRPRDGAPIRLASGPSAPRPAATLAWSDDNFETELKALQSDVAQLESTTAEF